jgi:DNA replication protein DnaC
MNISYFTPSMNEPATLEAIFTAREPLLQQLLSRIRDSAETGNCHYSLLVGPRGIGKSHLVSLVYHRVKANPALSERLRIAWLLEDPYSVDSYAALLREILIQLNEEYSVPRWDEKLETIQTMSSAENSAETVERALEGVR